MVIVLVRACAFACARARAWFVLYGCNHQVLLVVEQVGSHKPRVVARELQRLPAGRSIRPTRATGAALRAQSGALAGATGRRELERLVAERACESSPRRSTPWQARHVRACARAWRVRWGSRGGCCVRYRAWGAVTEDRRR